jgi:hypothetical protein
MPGRVPGIHVLNRERDQKRGWPGPGPAMTMARVIARDGWYELFAKPIKNNSPDWWAGAEVLG